MTATIIEPDARLDQGSSDEDDLAHLFCDCEPDESLCGADLTGDFVEMLSENDLICVVCAELSVCDRCGMEFEL